MPTSMIPEALYWIMVKCMFSLMSGVKMIFLIFFRPRELPPRLVRGTFAPSEGLLTSAAFQVE